VNIHSLPTTVQRLVRAKFTSVQDVRASIARLNSHDRSLARKGKAALLTVTNDSHRASAALLYVCIAKKGSSADLQRAERSVLCPRSLRWRGIRKACRQLLRVQGIESIDGGIHRRLQSYLHLAEAVRSFQSEVDVYTHATANRAPALARSAIAVAALTCCQRLDPKFSQRLLPSLFEPLGRLMDAGADPRYLSETIAGAMFMLLGDCNEQKQLSALELQLPIVPYIYSDEFANIFEAAQQVHIFVHLRDLITIERYVVDVHKDGGGTTFIVSPLNESYHRSCRIASHLRKANETVHYRSKERSLAPSVIESVQPGELRTTPYHRYAFALPDLSWFHSLSGERLLQRGTRDELLLGSVVDLHQPTPSEPSLKQRFSDLEDLRRASELFCRLLISTPQSHPHALVESLTSAPQDHEFNHFCGPGDEGRRRESTYERISWYPDKGGFPDLFYQPLIKVDGHTIMALPIVSAASLERNHFWGASDKGGRNGGDVDVFSGHVAEVLRSAQIGSVVAGKKILRKKPRSVIGDIDVALLHDDELWVFECKMNSYSATVYERRDLLGDIEKGVSQVQTLVSALQEDPLRALELVQAWFGCNYPKGTVLKVRGGVILSVREYSGVDIEGVPIRDIFTLKGTLSAGKLEWMQTVPDATRAPHVTNYWKGSDFCYEDFVAYWSSKPPGLTLYDGMLLEYCSISQTKNPNIRFASYMCRVGVPHRRTEILELESLLKS